MAELYGRGLVLVLEGRIDNVFKLKLINDSYNNK